MSRRRRVALDHNFPRNILDTLERFIPEVSLVPIRTIGQEIDVELAELEDHDLVYELARQRWPIMVTANYKMLLDASVLVALHDTKLTLFSIEGVGDDPVLATGALLRDLLPAIRKLSAKGQVFRSRPTAPAPTSPLDLLANLAGRQDRDVQQLLDQHRVRDWRRR